MKFLEIGAIVFGWVFWILAAVVVMSVLVVAVLILAAAAREAWRKQERIRKDGQP